MANAWSHPHSSNLLTRGFLSDRYYGGSAWGVKFNGTSTKIDCGSGATLDDIPNADMTLEGWFLGNGSSQTILSKGVYSVSGFSLYTSGAYFLALQMAFATTFININTGAFVTLNLQDGKWHHYAIDYVSATKVVWMAVDGVWYTSGTGVGAYVSDAAASLMYGRRSDVGAWYLTGSLGWQRISNIRRYTPGTNFLPPRAIPAVDGNTVEQWQLDEGTGVTATAQVTTPGNDGTITAGTWEPQWYDEGTPVRLRSVLFATAGNTQIDCGSDAGLDDLADNAFTIEGWVRGNDKANHDTLFSKGDAWATRGWYLRLSIGGLYGGVACATTDASAIIGAGSFQLYEDRWHHIAMTWDDAGDRKCHIWLDGTEIGYGSNTAGVGAIVSDAADNFYIGSSVWGWKGAISWCRISNVVRYVAPFTPAPRSNPPAPDANTLGQWNMTEGFGTAIDNTGSIGAAADGTLTNGTWNNSPAMESDSPGARNYAWGYVFGIDAPNEGFKQIISGSSVGADYVLRGLAYSEDGLGIPGLVVYDETNSKEITHIYGTTGSTEKAPDILMCSFELPYIGRPTGTVANCVNFSVKMVNVNGTGSVVGFQQVELLNNLVDNPSLDSGAAANPWIPNGFTNYDMDAGDSEIYATGHSANNCIVFHTGTAVEGIQDVITAASGKFYDMGGFGRGDGVNALAISPSGGHALFQYSTVDRGLVTTPLNSWKFAKAVWRSLTATPTIFYYGGSGAIGDRYLDDLYAILMDDVSLTVTPASAANSVESGGIRVDGWDLSPQAIPAGRLFANSGWVRFRYIPRHNGADALKFGNNIPHIVSIYSDVTYRIQLYWSAANTITLHLLMGGIITTNTWATAGYFIAGGNYLLEIRYDINNVYLYVDGVLRITVTPVAPIVFTTIPSVFYPSSYITPFINVIGDAVFLAP